VETGIQKSEGLDSRSTDCGNDKILHSKGKENIYRRIYIFNAL